MNETILRCHKRIDIERHIQPCSQIRLRTYRLHIQIMTMHTCAANCESKITYTGWVYQSGNPGGSLFLTMGML